MIAYLILNYETFWETEQCVKSIRELKHDELYKIIIVDNGSSNDSYNKLINLYANCNYIIVLKTSKNLGFAQGNNVGFEYICKFLQPSFIVMANSDILFTDKEFEKKLYIAYNFKHFAIAGPNVKNTNGISLNPMKSNLIDMNSVSKECKKMKCKLLQCKLKIDPFVCALNRAFSRKRYIQMYNYNLDLERGYQLHGCIIIFSKEYFSKFHGIYSKTFLYYEEDFLRFRCIKSGMNMVYLKDVYAIHNESQTENYITKSISKKHKKRYSNMLHSLKLLYEYLNDEDCI